MRANILLTLSLIAFSSVQSMAQTPNPPAPPAPVSQNTEANALYLQAQDRLSHSDPRTGGALANAREAISLYHQALAHDPHLAIAYVQTARAWLALGYSSPGHASASEIASHTRAALTQALAIDPNLTEAHSLLATILYTMDYDWPGAEREYRWTLDHDPNNAGAHSGYAAFLATMGRFDEALAQAGNADTLRHSPGDDFNRARILYSMRNYDAAVDSCRQALARQENQAIRFYLGLMLVAQGHPQDAVAEFEHAASEGDNAGAALGLAYGYAVAGRRDDALRVLHDLQATHAADVIVPYRLAAVYLALGDRDAAIKQLHREYSQRGNWLVQLKVDPVMDPLRDDPRFQALMRTMRFPT